ncbi:hypothetical protein LTR70_005533 [Exophiala xenobiotica]|uniref:DUF2415 domain-containing protein n=1 Tax=Lithohypha guttulata TaxID=1690604 RepID=A0ABR0K9K4_9EURO|nr:hypothetical protein LTR24_005249 [Lithohypha guttulata]KAK5318049.1 hypothetical protein LTR70_005533 [Exophiala xenobiotica]
MTVDPLFLQSTTTIAYPDKFYPAEIEVPHHQLRNFISTVYNDKIFYVNRYDIYVLDLASKERFVLVTVPFEARCLTAAHGWVCVGGETKGDCAFIHVGENDDGQPGTFCHELLVEMLGKEIVNAMTVQMLKPELDGHKEEVIVLISNNDHTVTIYSLTRREVLATIEHPQPMNYAVLSPDSTIMAAVGDENKVYFMKRVLEDEEDSSPQSTTWQYPNYDWQPLLAPDTPKGIAQPEDFSFAVAFSPDGRLCAVSSQGGAITVFDMEAIAEEVDPPEDAILCTFKSSRASLWGCVRSIAFSPARWDVLAWAEDHGQIGVADVRQGFRRRQHIELRKEAAAKVDIKDVTPSDWKSLDVKERLRRQHQQRMQALRGHPPLGARSFNDLQRNHSSTEHLVPDQVHTLSDRERSVIQALETTIDQIDNAPEPYSINYTSTQPRMRPSASQSDTRREYEVQLLNPSARLVNSHGPRRRESVVLSESQPSQQLTVDESTRMAMTASPGPMSDDGLPPLMTTNDITPSPGSGSSQPMSYNIPPSDPWHVIEASLVARRNPASPSRPPPTSLFHIENAIYAERQLANRLERQLDDERRLSTLLRSELEARERLLEARQQELQSERAGGGEVSPSLERLLHRQLHSERDHGQRRSEELEIEIRNMSRRVNQLMDERDSYLQRYRAVQGQSSSTSAQTSALPTTLILPDPPHPSEVQLRMQTLEDDRRSRAQRISDLEHQVRRAESRVELASVQSNVESNRARPRPHDREESPILASRILPIPTPTSGGNTSDARRLLESFDSLPSLSPTSRRLRQRTPAEIGLSSTRATIPRISELANRVTDNDLRLARIMMMRNSADGNGNWTPAAAHRYLTGQAPSQAQNGGTSSLEDIIRESGVGTAGIGWSPDGLRLFAGSEHGIFEFRLNVQDRMQCPIVEMR